MIPAIDMRSDTGEVAAADRPSRRARIRLAGNAGIAQQASLMLAHAFVQLNSTTRKDSTMRHAAPHSNSLDRRLDRVGELIFAGIAYAIASLAAGLVTLGSALAIWGLWQWLGVN